MKLLNTFLIISLLSITAFSQLGTDLRGFVTDSNGVVEGATITLTLKGDRNIVYTTLSDSQGKFFLAPKETGDFLISASINRAGNARVSEIKNIRILYEVTTEVDLRIEVYRPIRETVTVSADQSQPIDDVSKTVNIITGQEMRDRADFALGESLRTIPGFRVQQLGGFGRAATIKTRGLRNQDTAILIDGVRLRDASAITGDASPLISDITLTSVSRVEVLRGSGSSLYGTNAIGGTVDFQTPRPQAGPHGQLSYAAGGLGLHRFRSNFSDGTKDGKFGYNLAAAGTVYTTGIDGEDDAHNTNFQSRIEYDPSSKTNISARFFVSDAFVRLNADPDTVGNLPPTNAMVIAAEPGVNFIADQNDPDRDQQSRFFNGQLAVTQVLNSKASLRGYYTGLTTSRRNANGVLGPGFQSESTSIFDGTIQTANATLNWSPNSVHEIKTGYEFEHERFGNEGFTPSGFEDFFTRATQSSNTVFVQDVASLFDHRLQLAGGFRAQFFSLGDPRFSLTNAPYSNLALENPPPAYTFDAAASYFFKQSGTKIRAHVGTGYRVPSLFERYGTFFSTFPVPDFVALGDPNLKPEKTIAFDGGIEQYFAGEKVKFTGVYFYTKLIDTIGFGNVVHDVGSTIRPFGGYENQKGGIARGAEFSGSVRPTSSTDIFASYTFTNSDQREPKVFGSGVIDSLGIPKHQFTLVATQRIMRFWVNFDLLATSKYLGNIFQSGPPFGSYVYRFGGNRRGDITAGYTFPIDNDRFNLRVFGTVENVFDQEYFENGFRTPRRNARIGLNFSF